MKRIRNKLTNDNIKLPKVHENFKIFDIKKMKKGYSLLRVVPWREIKI